jgi:hypothetical protein
VGELGFEGLCIFEAVVLGEEGGAGAGFFPGGVGSELPVEVEDPRMIRGLFGKHHEAVDLAEATPEGNGNGGEVGDEEVEGFLWRVRGVHEEAFTLHEASDGGFGGHGRVPRSGAVEV